MPLGLTLDFEEEQTNVLLDFDFRTVAFLAALAMVVLDSKYSHMITFNIVTLTDGGNYPK